MCQSAAPKSNETSSVSREAGFERIVDVSARGFTMFDIKETPSLQAGCFTIGKSGGIDSNQTTRFVDALSDVRE